MEQTTETHAIACAVGRRVLSAVPKKKPRRTQAQKRKRDAILPLTAHAPDYEDSVVDAVLLLLRDHPERLPEALAAVGDWQPFEQESCRRVIEAVFVAHGVSRLDIETVMHVVRLSHEQEGIDHESAPATALLTRSITDVISVTAPDVLNEKISRAMAEVQEAADNRRKAAAALDTLHDVIRAASCTRGTGEPGRSHRCRRVSTSTRVLRSRWQARVYRHRADGADDRASNQRTHC